MKFAQRRALRLTTYTRLPRLLLPGMLLLTLFALPERMTPVAANALRAVTCNGWDTQFGLPNGVNGSVNALAVSGTDIFVGGQFTTAGNVTARNVAKFDTLTNTWSALGNGGGNGVNSPVLALVVDGNYLYVGGFFSTANVDGMTVSARGVAKFELTTSAWSGLGTDGNGVDAPVTALAAKGNELYVGGYFKTANLFGTEVAANYVAKVNTLTGAWSALGTNGNGLDESVTSLAVVGDDLYAGGLFLNANAGGTGVAARFIARVNPATGVWSGLGTGGGNGVSGLVYALTGSANKLFVGGYFLKANVGGTEVAVNNVAQFDPATNGWSALGNGGGNGVNEQVNALVFAGDDLYVGGNHSAANVGGTTVSTNRVARVNTVTGAWSALGSGGGNGVNDVVRALALGNGELFVGGTAITQANVGSATVSVSRIARVNPATGTWRVLGAGNGLNGRVLALAVSGTNVYAGGEFTTAGNLTAYFVAKFDTLTNTWSTLGTGGGNGVSGPVYALAVSGNELYVGGYFSSANAGGVEIDAYNVAKVNTQTGVWSKLGAGMGNGVDDAVNALALSGNTLFVGGEFLSAYNDGGPVKVNRLARFNLQTSTWQALGTGGGTGVNGSVRALALNNNQLYVGGYFSAANAEGAEVSASNIAQCNTQTGAWSKLGTDGNGVNDGVFALAMNNGGLYVGGNFTAANAGGTLVSANYVAKVNPATGVWSKLGTDGNGVDNPVHALALNGSELFVGGFLFGANEGGTLVIARAIAKLDTLTGNWSALLDVGGGNGVGNQVAALAYSVSGLFVGGSFTSAGDRKVALRLGRYCAANSQPNTLPTITPLAQAVAPGSTQQRKIAVINDAEDAANLLAFSLTSANPTNGVTLSNLIVDNAGNVWATITTAANNNGACNGTLASFGLKVTDTGGLMATTNVNVTNGSGLITVSPASLPNGLTGAAYQQSIAALPIDAYGYAVTGNGLPPGLTLNPTSGVLSGMPVAPGNYTFVIRATSPGGCSGSQAYNLLITGTCTTVAVNPATLPAGMLGTVYNQTLTATGGTAPYSFSVASGALPSGLTLNAATGVLSGTPLATGTFIFTLRATSQGGCAGQRQYVLTVNCGAITLSPQALPTGVKGAPYTQTLTASPAGTYTFNLLLGSLPPGFTLSSAGVLSGVTNQTGTYNFTVKAVHGSCQGTKSYTLVISASIAAALAQLADYNGDGQSDFALRSPGGAWRLSLSGNHAERRAQTQNWGVPGDLPLLGDYDGDGQTDLAVFRPANGTWYIKGSRDSSESVKAWGTVGDVPVPGDYDGDGRTDLAVFRPGDGHWYVLRSADQQAEVTAWGAGYAPYYDVAVPGDYDGDGRTDRAVFRRANGTWYIKRSSDGRFTVKVWGVATDVPVAADYDGDGRTDFAVWRQGRWYIWQSANDSFRVEDWGTSAAPYSDQAVPGDYDGDGKADVAVWRAGDQTWYVRGSVDGSVLSQTHGQTGDRPVAGLRVP